MDKRGDLIRFYELLAHLEHKHGGKRTLAACSGRSGWPQRGVYFFFENGEARTHTGSGARVVRVGSHALTADSRSTLWRRLKAHQGTQSSGGGNHRGSIFRLLVGTAIAARHPELAVGSWDNRKASDAGAREHEHSLETQVSRTIGAMPFLWLEIDDEPGEASRRGYIERNAIALLSNYGRAALDPASAAWLGRDCSRERVRASGLWNQDHVREDYDPCFLDELTLLIDGTTSR